MRLNDISKLLYWTLYTSHVVHLSWVKHLYYQVDILASCFITRHKHTIKGFHLVCSNLKGRLLTVTPLDFINITTLYYHRYRWTHEVYWGREVP